MVEGAIQSRTTAVVLNDIINGNLRRKNDPVHNQAIAASGLIDNLLRLVAGVRPYRIPIFWIHVGRRPDRSDVTDNLVDFASGWHHPNPPVVPGSYEAAQLEGFEIAPEDQVVIKPRFDPFIYSDLDLQLRARRVDTILLGGYSTNVGVESCARTAHDLGYNVVVVSDCCYNVIEELHRHSIEKSLPRFSRVMTTQAALARLVNEGARS